MKKILAIIIILMFTTTISAGEIPIPVNCEEINGQLMCLTENYEYDIRVIFTDDVFCFSDELSTNPFDMGICFSTIKFTETQKFKVAYQRETTIEEQFELEGIVLTTEEIDKTYFPSEEIEAVIHPDIINFEKCNQIPDEESGFYETICPFKGKTYSVDFLIMPEKSIMILEITSKDYLTLFLENIIYIILIIVIVAFAYSIIKKPKIKTKPSKKRRRKR